MSIFKRLKDQVQAARAMAQEVRASMPVAPAQLIAVMARMTVQSPKGGLEEAAQLSGVTAGVFAGVHMPWMQRMSSDPVLSQRFAVELDLASRALRGT